MHKIPTAPTKATTREERIRKEKGEQEWQKKRKEEKIWENKTNKKTQKGGEGRKKE